MSKNIFSKEKFLRQKNMRGVKYEKQAAFTLAEVLITLGIIGVVAAVTMPIIVANIQDRVRTEQVRSAKYKLTLATDKMKSLGLLLDSYSTTEARSVCRRA